MNRRRALLGVVPLLATALVALGQSPAAAADPDDRTQRTLPAHVADFKMAETAERDDISTAQLDQSLADAEGTGTVVVRLKDEAVAEQDLPDDAAAAAKQELRTEQSELMRRIRSLDSSAELLAQTQVALNAVFVEIDQAVLPRLANDPAVERIAPVGNYELDLSETVPYIGAGKVQKSGTTGKGIRVAVLDSGIDYTHADLGGSGEVADFDTNDPNVLERRSFPTGKVVAGYDFVGSTWTGAADSPPELPDPDPIDDGAGGGHGTHVADIIAGQAGVAPDASLVAVKVCSSLTPSCSGIALIQGVEYSLDPNGDGRLNDRVHIMNMSLGSSYGQPFDDDLAAAVDNATAAGVLTVASAGNSADKPYANGTPAAAPTALSVAQTAVPSAQLQLMEILAPTDIAGEYPAVFQPWSAALTSPIESGVLYGDGTGGNLLGCTPFPEGTLEGKIVLVDRGTCDFSTKISNIAEGGGALGIIGLVAPGDPFEGGEGGGDLRDQIPGFMVSQSVSNLLKSGLPDTVARFDPATGVPLSGTIVGSSSRGPNHEDTHLLKPEIGAPGASISAIAGTGTDTGPFGGTSGAAPMVAGAAALVLDATGGVKTSGKNRPGGKAVGRNLTPLEVKSLLVNNGYTKVVNDALTGALAPITRIGGGEVRADKAVAAPTAAWASDVASGTLSFGFVDVPDTVTITRTVTIRNYDNTRRIYQIKPTFRFADDRKSRAVSVSAPDSVVVRPGKGRDTSFEVTLTIDGSKLPANQMSSGEDGANPATLTTNEYDGYLVLDDGGHKMTMPWHVLPRQAAQVEPGRTTLNRREVQNIRLKNTGSGTTQNDAYALLATSDDLPEGPLGGQAPTPDLRAVGVNTFPVEAGFCSDSESFVWAFAINTWERQQHLLPVSHQVYLDTDQDGVDDYVILNRDASGLSTIADGRQLAWVLNLETGSASAFFFAEHSTNTGNTVLRLCGEQIGMSADNLLETTVGADFVAQDFYFGGPGDEINDLVVTPLGERYVGEADDIPAGESAPLTVFDYGAWPGNTDELGVLLFTNGDRGAGNRGAATEDTEALVFLAR